MSMLKRLIGSAAVLIALTGGLRADVTMSQSNDPAALLGAEVATLLVQERLALGSLSEARFDVLTRTPKRARKARAGSDIDYTRAWVDSRPAATGGDEFQCLARAMYFEARGESVAGQAAVGEVVLNRVDDPRFPDTICGVVHQSNARGCQFSWTCDGRADRVRNTAAYGRVAKVARALLDGAPRALTDGATYFHTPAVRPSWSRRFTRTAKIGQHIFYRNGLVTAMR